MNMVYPLPGSGVVAGPLRCNRRQAAKALLAAILLFGAPWAFAQKASASSVPSAQSGMGFWIFHGLQDQYVKGDKTYVEYVDAHGEKRLWNPETRTSVAFSQDLLRGFKPYLTEHPLYNDVFTSFPGGVKLKQSILSYGFGNCYPNISVSYTYVDKMGISSKFYIVEKYKASKITNFCHAPVRQIYGTGPFQVIMPMTNRGVFIMSFGRQSWGVILETTPSFIIQLDDDDLLIPASLLDPALDAAGQNNEKRYQVLLEVIAKYPPKVILHSQTVE